jgi:hypothetical protein
VAGTTPIEIDAKTVVATARPELEASVDPPLWQYFHRAGRGSRSQAMQVHASTLVRGTTQTGLRAKWEEHRDGDG